MRRGDTQLSFAEALGCERHIVASVEGARQNATPDFLVLLRRKLNVDIWWVLTGEGEMYIQYDAGDKSEVFKLRKKVDTLEKVIEKFIN
jgi:transcriptional regulator with XRE-family HTH domain